MATAKTIITSALRELRLESELIPAQPHLHAEGLERLISMLQEWSSAGIATGITLPTLASDELNNPRDIQLALSHALALEMMLFAPQEPSRRLLRQWRVSRRRLKAKYGPHTAQAMPSKLPMGQGNQTGPRSKRFFPDTDTLGNNSDSLGI